MSVPAAEELEFKTYTFQSGAVYEGTFKGTKRHGKGHWRHPDGDLYEGEYFDNKQHGLGLYIVGNSGQSYMGQWSMGVMSGEGVYYFAAKHNTYYLGGYENDKKHGSGFYMYDNGVITVQTWVHGEMTAEVEAAPADMIECARRLRELFVRVRAVAPKELGQQPDFLDTRTFQFPSGATYNGQFYGTKKHGQGYWVHPDGDSYEGQFEDNKHVGWGVYISGKSGKKYVGQWQDGKMNGWGVYFFNSAETEYFVGQYKEDKKDGRGLYHFAESGHSKVQTWEAGELKKEFDADENAVGAFLAAIRKLITICQPVAPHYKPIAQF